jgi:protein JSN1
MNKITDCLRPYTVALFLDQYGNYVLQCCLRFGTPYNDYIFETMLSRMWEISQGRFGSRAMRACLESHHANKTQQRMLAAAIALHSVQLATNANGALLLTWFLDTCNFPKRRTVLAPRLVPHLVHLCTHKVAYLTVLKVINQKNEPEARDTILKALFFSPGDKVLEDILKDHQCGATLIFKVLTTPFFEESMRPEVVQNIRNVLLKMKATPPQGYKRLMDEVGLSTRNAQNNASSNGASKERDVNGTPNERRSSHASHHGSNVNTPTHGRNAENNVGTPPFYTTSPAMYDPAVVASAAAGQFSPAGQLDQQTLRALEQFNSLNGVYGGGAPPGGIGSPAFQYQLLQQQMAAGRGAGAFFGMPGMAGFNGQQTGVTEQFRGQQGNNPIPPPGMGNPMLQGMNVNPGFNPLVAQQLMSGYGYGQMNGVPMFAQQQQQQQTQQQQQQQQQGGSGGGHTGGRRGGRVSAASGNAW